jgi:small ligand-binding sensory domain FIST
MIILRFADEEKPAYADSNGRKLDGDDPPLSPSGFTCSIIGPAAVNRGKAAMRCISVLSTARTTNAAFHQVVEKLDARPAPRHADLTMIFSSTHHAKSLGRIASAFLEESRTRHVLGCTGESIVGEDLEVEDGPALAVWSVSLPGVEIQPVRLEEPGETPSELKLALENPDQALMLLMGDPFSFRADQFLNQINKDIRGLRVVGGMASGSQAPGGNQLVLDGGAFEDGAVALLLRGRISVRTVVSQGCRPIGRPMIVTKAEQNIIREVGRRPTLEVLRDMFQELSSEDQRKVQDGLHIGRVINEYQESFDRGDFLVRNVSGADDSGAIQITDVIRVGQTVQFHVRDAETADEDLRVHLLRARDSAAGSGSPAGALLFSCNGRGTRLFDRPNHDVSLIHEILGPIPVAGFFAMGEIGPIGGQNFVHGFTASIVLFEQTA